MSEQEKCPKCNDAGWLWGRELEDAGDAEINDSQTQYACDGIVCVLRRQLAHAQAERDAVYALGYVPLEQARQLPLDKWVATRFVHVEKHNQIVAKIENELDKAQAENERLRKERDAIQSTLTSIEHEVALVYCHITNGAISKCNTDSQTVIAVADDVAIKERDSAVAAEREKLFAMLVNAGLEINHWHDNAPDEIECRFCGQRIAGKGPVCSAYWTPDGPIAHLDNCLIAAIRQGGEGEK